MKLAVLISEWLRWLQLENFILLLNIYEASA